MLILIKKCLFILFLSISLLPREPQANPLVLDDINVDSGLTYSNSMLSNADNTAFYFCGLWSIKTYIDTDLSLLLTQDIQLPTEELSNCAIHIINNKLFVIRTSEYFVYTIDETGSLSFSSSKSANIGNFFLINHTL